MSKHLLPHSTVYGPVQSWRFGPSLGIDPIFATSICSFNCVYCQLGAIQQHTLDIREYVATAKVMHDLKNVLRNSPEFDVITFSGSGEPTLAANLGEIASRIHELLPDKPRILLTNGTTLGDARVSDHLQDMDRVILKLDAATENVFQKINRPVKGLSIRKIVSDAIRFRSHFKGEFDLQIMFMPLNLSEANNLIPLINELTPAVVQLNTPTRPYPLTWHRENRGNHKNEFQCESREITPVSREEAREIEELLRAKTHATILSIYR